MSDQAIDMDDRAMFESAMQDAPVETGAPRDELGRFAPKAEPEAKAEVVEPVKEVEQPVAVQPVTEKPDDAANVPSWRLKELREERDTERQNRIQLQNQMQQMEARLKSFETPKAEPVDFFADPDQALKQRLDPLRSDLDSFKNEMRLEMSRELAVVKHGAAAVQEMEAAVQQAMQSNHPDVPALAARMRSSNNPASVAMDWHKNQKLKAEVGDDLGAYKDKLQSEFLKNPEFLAKALEAARTQAGAAPTRPAINLPPSLNKTAGSSANSADDGDVSDTALFKQAMRR